MKSILCVIIFFTSLFSNAQNVAYIHQDSILAALPSYKKNVTKLDSIGKAYQEEIKTAKEQWNQKLATLLKPYNVKENEDLNAIKLRMSSIDTTSLSILIDEDKIIGKRAQNFDNMINSMFKSDVQPLLDKVNKVIEDYAKKNKIDYVLVIEQIRPALAYIDRRKNITKHIVSRVVN